MEIQVLNPSSRTDTGITEDLQKSLHWHQGPWMPQVRCLTLEEGPCGISTARDSDAAAPAVIDHIERESGKADVVGFVVACFSDPGVFAARGITKKPVVGIGEAGFAAALALGDRFGTMPAIVILGLTMAICNIPTGCRTRFERWSLPCAMRMEQTLSCWPGPALPVMFRI
jgi:Asp/Glu/hydantoin racemase